MAKKITTITIETTKYYTPSVASKYLGYKNRSGLMYHINQGRIPKKYLIETRTMSSKKILISGERILQQQKGAL